jgi:hypothetical protein
MSGVRLEACALRVVRQSLQVPGQRSPQRGSSGRHSGTVVPMNTTGTARIGPTLISRVTVALVAPMCLLVASCAQSSSDEGATQKTPVDKARALCGEMLGAAPLLSDDIAAQDLTPQEANKLLEHAANFARSNPEWTHWEDHYAAWVRTVEPMNSNDFYLVTHNGTGMPPPVGLEHEFSVMQTYYERICPIGGHSPEP